MPDFTSLSFQRPKYSVPINILWFLSLVVALITASLGILVKQWFHELLSYKTHDPKERLKLRFFREAGLERWKVFAIASALPLLLQLALLLFFIGLALFLQQQHPAVAWAASSLMISWLMFFLFTIAMPLFSSQCPYKIPMLNASSHWARAIYHRISLAIISVLRQLFEWLWFRTTDGSYSKKLAGVLHDRMNAVMLLLRAFEEDKVSQNTSLDAPVAIHAAVHVLRGEHLNDSIADCFTINGMQNTRDRSEPGAESTSRELISKVHYSSFFGVRDGSGQVEKFAFEAIQDDRFRSCLLGQVVDPYLLAMLYPGLTRLRSKAYDPQKNFPISSQSLPAFVQLIQANPTSASFSLLAMSSIRHRTLTDHPSHFDSLFLEISESEKYSYRIGKLTVIHYSHSS